LWAANAAYRLWFRTRRYKINKKQAQALAAARKEILRTSVCDVPVFIWGEGTNTIVLVHGWSGNAGQLAMLAVYLSENGMRVIAYDGPAHGGSEGNSTNILQLSAVLQSVCAHYGPISSLLGHSFGCAVVAHAHKNALSQVKRLIFVSCSGPADYLLSQYFTYLDLKDKTRAYFMKLLRQHFGENVLHEISVNQNMAQCAAKVLLVHDKRDSIVPSEKTSDLLAVVRGASLVLTSGLGHQHILNSQRLKKLVLEFVVY